MSLLDTASLVITPNGTKASTLYSVVPSDGSGDMTVTRATTATRVNSAGLIESVASNIPRLDYSNGTCPSILVEPQRTNLFTYSEQFDNANWNKFSATVTANTTTAPDGTNSADQVVFTGFGDIEQEIFYASGNGTHTISCYVKTNSGTQDFRLKLTHAGVVNYFSPTYTATTEWQRFTFTQAFGAGGTGFFAGINCTSGTLNLWGGQLEGNSSYATSYIPTTSASVTRNADVISKTGISSLIGQTEGVIYFDYTPRSNYPLTEQNLLTVYDSASVDNNNLQFFIGTSSIIIYVVSGGALQTNLNTGISPLARHKIAVAYKNNDLAVYIDGALVGTDTSITVPALNSIVLNNYGYGSYMSASEFSNIALWKTRLTNTQLQTLTSL